MNTKTKRRKLGRRRAASFDHYRFLGNCPPTPPLSQQYSFFFLRIVVISTVNPLLSPPGGGVIISNPFEGGLNRDGLFKLEKTMVSVLHKNLEYKVQTLKNKKFEVMQPRIKNKSSPHKV